MNAKNLAFLIMMGALGNVLFAISYFAGPIAPGVALDFSLIAVLIAGIFIGPKEGLITGLIAGILPGIMFGPAGSGGALALIGLPVGKALTGLTAGLLAKNWRLKQTTHASILGLPLTLASYIPEAIFTYAYFSYLMPLFIAQTVGNAIIITIMIKALVEVTIMGFIVSALIGNKGFNEFIRNSYCKPKITTVI
jgi:riboflavin transporter FmnP